MQQQQPENPFEIAIFGTCKIKDALYIGDEYAAKDLEFIVLNKVGFIVNSVNQYIENHWESMGVIYLAFQINEGQVPSRELIEQIFNFIEECYDSGQSCLIHSVHGQSRACSLAAIYLMRKQKKNLIYYNKRFKWSLYKSLEYLNSRRSDLEIKTSFFQMLSSAEQLLQAEFHLTSSWTVQITEEESLIVNTFLNSKPNEVDSIYTQADEFKKFLFKDMKNKLKWSETTNQMDANINQHLYKSILKGSKKVYVKTNPNELEPKQQPSPILPAKQQKPPIVAQPQDLQIKDKENIQPVNKIKKISAEPRQLEDIRKMLQKGQNFGGLLEPSEQEQQPILENSILPSENQIENNKIVDNKTQPKSQNNLTIQQPLKELSNSAQNIKLQQKAIQINTEVKTGINMSAYRKKEVQKQIQQKRNISNPRKQANNNSKSMNQVASQVIILRPKIANFDEPIQKPTNDRNIDVNHLFDQYEVIQSQKEMIKEKLAKKRAFY